MEALLQSRAHPGSNRAHSQYTELALCRQKPLQRAHDAAPCGKPYTTSRVRSCWRAVLARQARAVAADARGGPADPSLAYTAKPLALAQHRALRPSYRHELPSRPF